MLTKLAKAKVTFKYLPSKIDTTKSSGALLDDPESMWKTTTPGCFAAAAVDNLAL